MFLWYKFLVANCLFGEKKTIVAVESRNHIHVPFLLDKVKFQQKQFLLSTHNYWSEEVDNKMCRYSSSGHLLLSLQGSTSSEFTGLKCQIFYNFCSNCCWRFAIWRLGNKINLSWWVRCCQPKACLYTSYTLGWGQLYSCGVLVDKQNGCQPIWKPHCGGWIGKGSPSHHGR